MAFTVGKKMKIISGGQTGADIAGVKAAKSLGIETGGWMPRGWKTLDGPKPEYEKLYGMKCHSSPAYPPRTEWNVRDAHLTIRFATKFDSAGERCTLNAIDRLKKPYIDVNARKPTMEGGINERIWDIDFLLRQFKHACHDFTINIAGNSEKTSPGIEEFVYEFLRKTLHEYKS